MAHAKPNTFNLFQEILLFTDEASRGGKLPVTREAYLRNLRRRFRGAPYTGLRNALVQLESQGLINLVWTGPEDFTANLTAKSQSLLHKPEQHSETRAQDLAKIGTTNLANVPHESPAPTPPSFQHPTQERIAPKHEPAPSQEAESPQSSPPQEAAEMLTTFGDVSGVTPPPAEEIEVPPNNAKAAQGAAEVPEVPVAAEYPPETETAPDREAEMTDWLDQRAQEMSEREDVVTRKEQDQAHHEQVLLEWEHNVISHNDTLEKRFQQVLGRAREGMAKHEHLLEERLRSLPSRDEAMENVLQEVRDLKALVEDLSRERGKIRRALEDARKLMEENRAGGTQPAQEGSEPG